MNTSDTHTPKKLSLGTPTDLELVRADRECESPGHGEGADRVKEGRHDGRVSSPDGRVRGGQVRVGKQLGAKVVTQRGRRHRVQRDQHARQLVQAPRRTRHKLTQRGEAQLNGLDRVAAGHVAHNGLRTAA
jgi:hypothetical protein